MKPSDPNNEDDVIEINGNSKGEALHKFLSDNTNVEWGIVKTGDLNNETGGKAYIDTSHQYGKFSFEDIYSKIGEQNNLPNVFEESHNHNNGTTDPSPADKSHYNDLHKLTRHSVRTYIYTKEGGQYIQYNMCGSYLELIKLIK